MRFCKLYANCGAVAIPRIPIPSAHESFEKTMENIRTSVVTFKERNPISVAIRKEARGENKSLRNLTT